MAVTRIWDADNGVWQLVNPGPPGPQGEVGPDGPGMPVGSIIMWGGDASNVPTGWLLCDGSLYGETTYPALFAAIGYGFQIAPDEPRLPDMRDRFVVGAGTTYLRNSKGGDATVVLTEANLASHDHGLAAHTHVVTDHTHTITHSHPIGAGQAAGTQMLGRGAASTGSADLQAAGTREINQVSQTGASSAANTGVIVGTNPQTGGPSVSNTATAGSGTAHENRPPYIGMFYIIKAVP